MSATIGKVYVDAVITDERYKECMALVQEANERIDELRELVRDYIDAPCTTCDCWQDEFRCWNYDGADCGLVARARELGIEVDE